MNSRLVCACASADSLAATPPAWSATSHDQTWTRSSLKPMTVTLIEWTRRASWDYSRRRRGGERGSRQNPAAPRRGSASGLLAQGEERLAGLVLGVEVRRAVLAGLGGAD